MTGPYQLFDDLEPAVEAALRASIRRWGVIVPVVVDQNGRTIDGHHRKRLAAELGVQCPQQVRRVRGEDEAKELARTLNEDRRHLLAVGDRREVVADLRQEGHSQRAIAGALGVSQSTIRDDLGALSTPTQSSQPDRVRTADGRTYPATRPSPEPNREADDPLFAPGEQEAIIDELHHAHGDDLTADQIEQALEENIESKRLPEPTPEWQPSKPDLGDGVSHPARFSNALMPVFADLLRTYSPGHLVLDPFAGTGKIHDLRPDWETWGIELEPEWAGLSEWTKQGSALDLPWGTSEIGAIVTSPTYGNRLADSHNASDPERRRSYTHDLGRQLHDENSGAMQWGPEYREFHRAAWAEASRVLCAGGVLILNIKDHIRGGERQHVAGWHVTELARLGFTYLCHREIETGNLRQGENGHMRFAELVYILRLDG